MHQEVKKVSNFDKTLSFLGTFCSHSTLNLKIVLKYWLEVKYIYFKFKLNNDWIKKKSLIKCFLKRIFNLIMKSQVLNHVLIS